MDLRVRIIYVNRELVNRNLIFYELFVNYLFNILDRARDNIGNTL